MRLLDFTSAIALSPISFAGVSCQQVVKGTRYLHTMYKHSHRNPLADAAEFYMKNQLAAALLYSNQPTTQLSGVPLDFAKNYLTTVSVLGGAMVAYLTLICTRESRHVYKNTKLEAVYDVTDPDIVAFHKKIPSGSSAAADHFLEHAPDASFAKYTEFLYQVFSTGGFSGGYGGSAWASVTKPLQLFAAGSLSLEGVLDQGFTLAHNNGPIFNKGMIYKHPQAARLIKLLDYQKAGVLAQKLFSGAFDSWLGSDVVETLSFWKKHFPEGSLADVDEKVVDKWGVSGSEKPVESSETKVTTEDKQDSIVDVITITPNTVLKKTVSPRYGKTVPTESASV